MKVVFDLSRLADNTSASFIFFPMSTQMPSDDRATNSMVAGRCKFWRKNLILYDELNVQQTLDLISSCDVIISTRLHSLIFSLAAKVPFINLIHHDKCRGYSESLGLLDWSCNYWNFNYDDLFEMVKDRLENKEKYVNILKEKHAAHLNILGEGCEHVHFIR